MEKLKELTLAILSGELLSDWVAAAVLVAYTHDEITLEQRKKLTSTAWLCGLLFGMVELAKSGSPISKKELEATRSKRLIDRPEDPEERLRQEFELSGRNPQLLVGVAADRLGHAYKEALAERVRIRLG